LLSVALGWNTPYKVFHEKEAALYKLGMIFRWKNCTCYL